MSWNYVSNAGSTVSVEDSQLKFTGTFSPSRLYSFLDVIDYAAGKFVALISSSGVAPTNNRDSRWSALILRGTGGGTGDGALSQAAYSLAQTGTNAAAAAQATASLAYTLATQGTNTVLAAHEDFTASGGQTSYTLAHSMRLNSAIVHINGLVQPIAEYTATGNTVVFSSAVGITANDIITVAYLY
jgi:hypothetical protein